MILIFLQLYCESESSEFGGDDFHCVKGASLKWQETRGGCQQEYL
jgi:hypothetical protein